MQIRVPPGTHNYVNELLAYPSLYGRRISHLSSWARMEAHIASVVVMKPTMQELKVTGFFCDEIKGHRVEEAYCNVFVLAYICLHPTNKRKKLNLIDTMIQ
jgi:hypothetical protein